MEPAVLWRKIRLVKTGNGGVKIVRYSASKNKSTSKNSEDRRGKNLKKVIIIYNTSYFYYLS